MVNVRRVSMIAVVIACFVGAQGNATVFASEETSSMRETPSSPSLTNGTSEGQPSTSDGLAPATSNADLPAATDRSLIALPQTQLARLKLDAGFLLANASLAQGPQRQFNLVPTRASALAGQVYQGRPYRIGRNGSIAAIMIGAAATIAGTAILVYANRPDCTINQFAGGCGYGTKVIGGSVVAGGVVGLFVGALTWR
jgi:hypothetical protein